MATNLWNTVTTSASSYTSYATNTTWSVVNCGPMEIIVVPVLRWFYVWCEQDCEPPENPRSPKFVVLTGQRDLAKLRGRRATDEDVVRWLADDEELYLHGGWTPETLGQLHAELRHIGLKDWQHYR